MKSKTNGSWLLMVVLFFVGIGLGHPLFSQFSASLLYNFQEDELVTRLNLDTDQVESLKKLGNVLKSQAVQDRENFKDNVAGLIAAAERRLVMAENLLNTFLNETQKQIIPEIKEEQKIYREFFLMNEVLVFDTVQTAKIQTIIETYKPQPFKEGDLPSEYSDDETAGQDDMNNQGVPGQRNGRMDQPERHLRNAVDLYIDDLKDKEKKKQKAIEVLLTPEQKIPYSQLKEILRKEFELRMEKEKSSHSEKGKEMENQRRRR